MEIPNLDSSNRLFMTWVPIRVRVRQVGVQPTDPAVTVTMRNSGAVGQFWFSRNRANNGADQVTITVPADGSPAEFWMAGRFRNPSRAFGDAAIAVIQNDTLLGSIPAMVRMRKNANTLTDGERDSFLNALSVLNGQGTGRFRDLRAMHVAVADGEAHRNSGFPSWHRAYLLDLERELQAIDPEVSLHYWRFDQAADYLFTQDFIGAPGTVRPVFSVGHPLANWSTELSGIRRFLNFAPDQAPPPLVVDRLGRTEAIRDEAATLDLGSAFGTFRSIYERNPHGFAHGSFRGDSDISQIHTAARDPLFFMLHSNVDRLWAKWQWFHRRSNRNVAETYLQGGRIGHNLDDTMWPWNGETGNPRPPTAPGGELQSSPLTDLPGSSPTVAQMIDFMNVTGQTDEPSGGDLGFCYDDVPFEMEVGAIT